MPIISCIDCGEHRLFNETNSSSYTPTNTSVLFTNGYAGNIEGLWAKDSFGISAATMVNNQCFVAANGIGGLEQYSDGVLGISWKNHYAQYICPNYIFTLLEQGKIDEQVIGLYLDETRPILHIGQLDKNIHDIFYAPNIASLSDPNFVIKIKNIGLKGDHYDQEYAFIGPINVAITTGTTDIKLTKGSTIYIYIYIYIILDDFNELMDDMKFDKSECRFKNYRYSCTVSNNLFHDAFPDIWLQIAGIDSDKWLKIRSTDYLNFVSIQIINY